MLTVDAGDVVVPEGKYLRITSIGELLRFWDGDMPAGPDEGWMRFNNGNRADAEAAVETRWFGDPQAQDRERADAEQNAVGTEPAPLTLRAMGEAYEHPDGADGEDTIISYLDDRRLWAELPADPREAPTWLRARIGEEPGSTASDSSIVETLVDEPTLALAPADTRATVLRVLALLDGSEIGSVDGAVTIIRFTWKTKWWSAWKDIRLDTERGLIVGVASSGAITGTEPSIGGLPPWDSRARCEISIADSAR